MQFVCARGVGGVPFLPTSKLEAGAEQLEEFGEAGSGWSADSALRRVGFRGGWGLASGQMGVALPLPLRPPPMINGAGGRRPEGWLSE
jgi:hypothetical protein